MDNKEIIAELMRVREELRRPPCWGPNGNGDMMVDMEVEAYEQDLDRLMMAALDSIEAVVHECIARLESAAINDDRKDNDNDS